MEDICFFEVNTKHISSSELKTSEFSRVRNIVGIHRKKKQIFFLFIQYTGIFQFTRQALKMQKPNIFENTNNGTTLFLRF